MSDLHSYFVAGPENLLPHHILKCEKPEKTLIRIVGELAENGLECLSIESKVNERHRDHRTHKRYKISDI